MLDLISSSLHEFYMKLVPGAPLGGSHHLTLELDPLYKIRIEYKTTMVTSTPISDEGLIKFVNWISPVSWDEIYKAEGKHSKACQLQEKTQCVYKSCFPEKTSKT